MRLPAYRTYVETTRALYQAPSRGPRYELLCQSPHIRVYVSQLGTLESVDYAPLNRDLPRFQGFDRSGPDAALAVVAEVTRKRVVELDLRRCQHRTEPDLRSILSGYEDRVLTLHTQPARVYPFYRIYYNHPRFYIV